MAGHSCSGQLRSSCRAIFLLRTSTYAASSSMPMPSPVRNPRRPSANPYFLAISAVTDTSKRPVASKASAARFFISRISELFSGKCLTPDQDRRPLRFSGKAGKMPPSLQPRAMVRAIQPVALHACMVLGAELGRQQGRHRRLVVELFPEKVNAESAGRLRV